MSVRTPRRRVIELVAVADHVHDHVHVHDHDHEHVRARGEMTTKGADIPSNPLCLGASV
jgi:hypothetical protein